MWSFCLGKAHYEVHTDWLPWLHWDRNWLEKTSTYPRTLVPLAGVACFNEVLYWSAHTRPVKVSAEVPKGSVSARVACWNAIMVFLEYFETYRTLRNTQACRRWVDQVQPFVVLVPEILIYLRIVITNRAKTVDDMREFPVVCKTIFDLFCFIRMQV